jgi:ferritin-like metal-binding protein YciE
MPMNSPHELFLHEIGDIYDAEQRILQILPALASESNDPMATQAYQMHEQQTRQQIQNLEQCYQILGVQPKRIPCTAIQGLKQEHDSFKKDNPSETILTMFDLVAALKTEHYEIASYRSLIDQARLMGQQQCVRLLEQNLQQEEAMAQKVTQIAHQLDQQQISQMGQAGQGGYQPQVNP